MITAVHLENWRAYKSFKIELRPGTTFLVAPNGVGKTSFIQAVRWAIDRDAKPTSKVMRRRARTTTVDVTFVAGERRVRIKRALTLGRGKTPADNTDAWIDDAVAEPADALRVLTDAWEADDRFVSRAAFLTDRFVDRDPDPDLRTHLTRLHALDHVQAAIASIASALKAATDEADSARKTAAASEIELRRAIDAAETAAEQLETSLAASQQLRAMSAAANHALREADEINAAHDTYDSWLATRASLVGEVATVLGAPPEELDLRPILRSAEAAATRQLMEAAEERARLRERLNAVEEALHRLQEAAAECPICRRPLDEASRHHAEEQHEHDRAFAAAQLSSLDDEAPAGAAAELRRLLDRAESLGEPPEPPGAERVELDPLRTRAAEAKTAFEKSLEDVGRAHRVVAEANEQLETIRA
ncbi:MAG: AAA family ATPase, partial [Chloroflexi bacterium]|nr:AAA family ATPase [Chloroflexota bacterium]